MVSKGKLVGSVGLLVLPTLAGAGDVDGVALSLYARDLSEDASGPTSQGRAAGPRIGGLPEGRVVPAVKLGTTFAIGLDALDRKQPDVDDIVLPQLYAAVDLRVRYGRQFLQLAPALILPATTYGELTYGGIGTDVGLGHIFREGSTSPYVSGGLAGRMLWADGVFSPGLGVYGSLGFTHDLGQGATVLGEVRVTQHTVPIDVSGYERLTVPLEPGFSLGIAF